MRTRRREGGILHYTPHDNNDYMRCIPIYKNFTGWSERTFNQNEYKKLPIEAKNYIKFIEEFLEVPINMISTGPERNQYIKIKDIF